MARERKIYLEGQRAGVDPDLPGIRGPRGQTADAKQRLRYLRTENIALKASLSEKHPDLVKIEKEIESFENGVSPEDDVQLQENQLEEVPLNILVFRYDNHRFLRVYPGNTSLIHELQKGYHQLIFF